MNTLLQQVLTNKVQRNQVAATQAAYTVPVATSW